MRAIELSGDIDEQQDEVGPEWAQGLSREWTDELGDARQDIYTLAEMGIE